MADLVGSAHGGGAHILKKINLFKSNLNLKMVEAEPAKHRVSALLTSRSYSMSRRKKVAFRTKAIRNSFASSNKPIR